ncbi:bifunctional phosphoribosyl-AMP cyclohydrolase/phosphoribosyl-ATP diphosphatase, partial [Campylobacter jejuni]|nr:bifunctional phosphoribosyl-AMP cyclohydrolase/phosphoribosyl-ATP diphosphatase [Campylobacter jejuni]
MQNFQNLNEKINWQKVNGLIPVIIQDAKSCEVLMLGFMDEKALEKSLESKKVVF